MAIQEGYKVTAFEAEGLWVAAPAGLVVSLRPPIGFTEVMATQDDFQPLRMIGTLKFQDPEEPDQAEFTFSPPVTLQVRFTGRDQSRSETRGKPLSFAWWNGNAWVRFAPGEGGPIVDRTAKSGGFRIFQIEEISDPGISWGT